MQLGNHQSTQMEQSSLSNDRGVWLWWQSLEQSAGSSWPGPRIAVLTSLFLVEANLPPYPPSPGLAAPPLRTQCAPRSQRVESKSCRFKLLTGFSDAVENPSEVVQVLREGPTHNDHIV